MSEFGAGVCAGVRFTAQEARNKAAALVIAHRLSTIHNADLIIVLDEGRVVEGRYNRKLCLTFEERRRILLK